MARVDQANTLQGRLAERIMEDFAADAKWNQSKQKSGPRVLIRCETGLMIFSLLRVVSVTTVHDKMQCTIYTALLLSNPLSSRN